MRSLARLLPYLRRHRGAYLLGLPILLVATACGAVTPPLVGRLVDGLKQGTALRDDILTTAALILGAATARVLLLFGSRFQLLAAARRVEFDFRNDLFAHLERLGARWYDANATGDVTSKAINDLEGVRMMVGVGLMQVVSTGLLFITSLSFMLWQSPALTAVSILPLLGVSAVMAWTGARMHDLSLAVQTQLGVLSTRAQENFTGVRVVRAFAQEEHEIARYRGACVGYRERNLRLARWRSGSWASILLLAEGAMVLTMLVGGRAILGSSLTAGTFATFVFFQFQLVWPMITIGWVFSVLQRGVACLGRLTEVLDAVPESDDARAVASSEPLRGRVEARGLRFSYAPDRAPALQDVSFTIEPGQKVAVVGRTGSGKSTLLQLLLRHYRIPDGMLFVDGRDVNQIPLAELRGAIGAVPQDLFLFSDRLRENIAFGAAGEASDEELRRASEISRLSADLEQFPQGLETVIGERGVTLSGGQRQRTALARALIREPRILVLDDALSAVDSQTEHEIQQRLREFMKGRTTIVITHRLSSVTDADLILVVEDGRLVERGRHAELVAAGGVYARLWESQKLAEELANS